MDSTQLFDLPALWTVTWPNALGWATLGLMAAISLGLRQALKGRDPRRYDARLAWLRAGIYFCVCLALSWLTGVLSAVAQRPLFTAENRVDPLWWACTGMCLLAIGVGYYVIWPRGTRTHGRPLHWPSVLVFGLLWGLSQAQLLLVFWALAERLIADRWLVALSVFLAASLFIGLWHSRYWDIYVAPEHNIEAWNFRKVLFAHIPNLVCTLSHLALFGQAGWFVVFQTLALLGSTYFMRFPPWRAETELTSTP